MAVGHCLKAVPSTGKYYEISIFAPDFTKETLYLYIQGQIKALQERHCGFGLL